MKIFKKINSKIEIVNWNFKYYKDVFSIKYLKDFKEEYEMHRIYQQNVHEVYGEPKPPRFKNLDLIKEIVLFYSRLIRCIILGHNYIDSSYGNPETGCIQLDCSRCGESHHQTLY